MIGVGSSKSSLGAGWELGDRGETAMLLIKRICFLPVYFLSCERGLLEELVSSSPWQRLLTYYFPVRLVRFCNFVFLYFFFPFVLFVPGGCVFPTRFSGSHHSGSPLARGARYCMSNDSSRAYTIPQTSSAGVGPGPDTGPGPGVGPGSEECGQTCQEPGSELSLGTENSDDAHGIQEPPDNTECG